MEPFLHNNVEVLRVLVLEAKHFVNFLPIRTHVNIVTGVPIGTAAKYLYFCI